MKKQIRLLIENLFDDIYDIEDQKNIDTEIADDNIKISIVNKLKQFDGNYTKYDDFNNYDMQTVEKYIKLADKLYIFFKESKPYYKQVYKVEKQDNTYKIIFGPKDYIDTVTYFIFYIDDEENNNHIKQLDIKISNIIELNGHSLKIELIELLYILQEQGMILDCINYEKSYQKIKELIFDKYTYDSKVRFRLTQFILDNFPIIKINDENIFSISNGLKAKINGIVFENNEVCKNFYEYLKTNKIKKYDCTSYGAILQETDLDVRYDEVNNIQNEFCIKNKFEQYTYTSDKLRILDKLEEETAKYCYNKYDWKEDFHNIRYMWSYEWQDKGKDSKGSFINAHIEFEFYDANNKYQRVHLYWKFYKSGELTLLNSY